MTHDLSLTKSNHELCFTLRASEESVPGEVQLTILEREAHRVTRVVYQLDNWGNSNLHFM